MRTYEVLSQSGLADLLGSFWLFFFILAGLLLGFRACLRHPSLLFFVGGTTLALVGACFLLLPILLTRMADAWHQVDFAFVARALPSALASEPLLACVIALHWIVLVLLFRQHRRRRRRKRQKAEADETAGEPTAGESRTGEPTTGEAHER